LAGFSLFEVSALGVQEAAVDRWLDAAARELARGQSRRDVLRKLWHAGLLAVGAGALGGLSAPAEGAAERPKRPSSTCTLREDATAVTSSFTTRIKKLTLESTELTPLNPELDRTSTTVIERKGALLLKTTVTVHSAGDAEVRMQYGAAFKGIKESVFTTDGSIVRGEIDGRQIVPFPVGAVPKTLQFKDGQPGAQVTVKQSITKAVQQIYAKALDDRPNCTPPPSSRPRGGDEFVCLSCKGSCLVADAACGYSLQTACKALLAVPFLGVGLYAVCLVAGTAACVRVAVACLGACRTSTACCPELCGTLPDWTCCHGGEKCLTFGTGIGVCCPAGKNPCREKYCCNPKDICLADGCCPPGQTVCNGICCDAGQPCVGGQCCPTRQVCGGVCCPEGQACDPTTRACAVVCAEGTRRCPDRAGMPTCCPFGSECCNNGECCLFRRVCCSGANTPCGYRCEDTCVS
jgi:hypothetical protein